MSGLSARAFARNLAAGCAAIALASAVDLSAACAETPADTLVEAWRIDDLITLDPAEIFELTGAEYGAQVYDRLVTYPVDDVENLQGHVAESWEIGEDGKTYTFKIRDGITFHSGNPLTAEDAAWSLQRVIKLNKTPSFILSQFGFTPENVEERIKAVDDRTMRITLDEAYAPTFFLYCLTAGVGSVVDKQEVMAHEKDGDMGHEWLRTASAGSGPFKLRAWKPNENLVIDANPDYWGGAPGVKRVFARHVPESATQQLLLEKGDIDIARDLENDQVKALAGNDEVFVEEVPKGAIWYLGLNQKNEYLAKPEVREALKYLIDYDGMASTILAGSVKVHQSFLPSGFLGAIEDKPYSLDVEKAKGLLQQAGLADGFSVTMDTRNVPSTMDMAQAIQATWAQAGIQLEILPGDNKQTLTKYRARTHDIYIGRWGPDYQDPHTNADTFASNPDNSDEGNNTGKLAWRNAWDIPEMTALTAAAVLEHDPKVRSTMYQEIQREHQATSPFVIMFQDIELIASRKNVSGMIWGPSFDDNKYWKATKK
ncbi:MAG: ABC transporter substrate-binding protein [Alphaproteobacteria bacterium]